MAVPFLKSARVVSLCTLVSRVLGLVRDILMAQIFGAGLVMDAFVNAFLIPNLLRRLLGEGALSSAFVTVLATFKKEEDRRETMAFINSVLTFATFLLLGITFLGLLIILLFPVSAFYSGLEAVKVNLTLDLSLILFPYVLFVCLLALVTGILNSWGHFSTPAIAPAVLNLFWIGGVLIATWALSEQASNGASIAPSDVARIKVVSAAIFVGGIFQLMLQVPVVQRLGFRIRPNVRFRGSGLSKVLVLAGPIVLGLAPTQLNVFFDRVIAEQFVAGDGAVSALFFGNRLMQFPLALIGIAMGTAIFPLLSSLAARKESKALSQALEKALRATFFLAVPAAVGLVVLSGPIVGLLFQHGAFDRASGDRTAAVVVAYAFGVPAFCGLQIVTRGLYAIQAARLAAKAALASVLVNLVLNLILVWPLGEAGLALSTSITSVLQLAYAWRLLNGRSGGIGGKRVLRSVGLSFVGAGVMAGGCLLVLDLFATPGPTWFLECAQVFVPMGLGAMIYFVVSWVLMPGEVREILDALGRRGVGPPG